ncbi:MAG TPA: hypothetical protein DEB39_10255 [Planctomycetaceae bacterium]|nr:hypothetical protein [Planctomycetaceae bacterium]
MSTITSEQRAKFQKLFEHGNKQMMVASFDYAADMFEECVLGDPGNVIYLKSFFENLKRKFADRKKRGFFGKIGAPSFRTKKPEQIFEASVKTLKSFPWDAPVLVALGKACLEMHNDESARVAFRFAVEADPNDLEANRNLAEVLREDHLYDEALACWARIRKVKPDDPEAIKAMKDIHVEKTIHKGGYESGDSKQVRGVAEQMKSATSESEDVMGRKLTYEEQVERRIKKNPGDVANYLEFAQYYYQSGNYEKAEIHFRKVVELSPGATDQLERLLDTQKQRLQNKAVQLKEEFEKAKSADIRDEFYKVKEELDAKTLELARFRIQNHPAHSGYRFEYGMLLLQRGMYKEAISEFQHAKADSMRKGDCLLALGQCFQQIKQYKLAMSHYREAVEAITENNDSKKKALYLVAKLALGLGEYDSAEQYASQLAAVDFSYKDVGELLDKATKRGQN